MDFKGLKDRLQEQIEEQIEAGQTKFILFPFGRIGLQVKAILNNYFGIAEEWIIDNHLSKYNDKIYDISLLDRIDCSQYILILATDSRKLYSRLIGNVSMYFRKEQIITLYSEKEFGTISGKYSYGRLCDHWLVESVGAFCSFEPGVDACPNHPVQYLSSASFIYMGKEANPILLSRYDDHKYARWYMQGIKPKGKVDKLTKSKIGNDVWLGKNVLITNGADIGNGVIAFSGSVITKDIPDYAVVAGIPAQIISYRYSDVYIRALNRIAWWDWPDDLIRARYSDFFGTIENFIDKYGEVE